MEVNAHIEDAELEDGECSDQNDDEEMVVTKSSESVPVPNPNYHSAGYRRGCIPQIVINSDQSDNSDEDRDEDDDDDDFYGKRTCRNSNPSTSTNASETFINPLQNPDMMQPFKKRRNNVWGAVMTEQILSQDIKQFGVKGPLPGSNRDVESYDFTAAKLDDRPVIEVEAEPCETEDIFDGVVDLEREVKRQQNRKRKRNVKQRLGQRMETNNVDERCLGDLNVTAQDSADAVTQAIIKAMNEQNVTLFTRIVKNIGNDMAIQLYNKTVNVEQSGGMMINTGNRRRSSGGVYIQLLKSEPSITEAVVTEIFGPENEKWNERKKYIRQIRKAARKRYKNQNAKKAEYDRPETPTPTRELEELGDENDNNNGIETEADATDLPERPDTPEPKDSSDNESRDDDEDEDIAVAIAKAKAAILKKQREMAGSKIDADQVENVEMT